MLIGQKDRAALDEEQSRVYERIASGPRGSVPDPFLAMMDAPHLAEAIQAVGAAIRYSGDLSDAEREVAILATAGAFGSGYEWDYHLPIAREAGVSEIVIKATLSGNTDNCDLVSATIIRVCGEAVINNRVPSSSLEKLVTVTNRRVASEIVAIAGYYQLLALFLSAGDLDHFAQYK